MRKHLRIYQQINNPEVIQNFFSAVIKEKAVQIHTINHIQKRKEKSISKTFVSLFNWPNLLKILNKNFKNNKLKLKFFPKKLLCFFNFSIVCCCWICSILHTCSCSHRYHLNRYLISLPFTQQQIFAKNIYLKSINF